MPADGIGYSFQPGLSNVRMDGRGGGGRVAGASPQQAVKILSLRVPEQLPASAPINRTLLTSPGAAGVPGGSQALNQVIGGLMQSLKPGLTPEKLAAPAPPPLPAPQASQVPTASAFGTSVPQPAAASAFDPRPSAFVPQDTPTAPQQPDVFAAAKPSLGPFRPPHFTPADEGQAPIPPSPEPPDLAPLAAPAAPPPSLFANMPNAPSPFWFNYGDLSAFQNMGGLW